MSSTDSRLARFTQHSQHEQFWYPHNTHSIHNMPRFYNVHNIQISHNIGELETSASTHRSPPRTITYHSRHHSHHSRLSHQLHQSYHSPKRLLTPPRTPPQTTRRRSRASTHTTIHATTLPTRRYSRSSTHALPRTPHHHQVEGARSVVQISGRRRWRCGIRRSGRYISDAGCRQDQRGVSSLLLFVIPQ